MSGTNRTVLSENVMKGASESTIAKALINANEEAIKTSKKGKRVKK